MGRIKKKGTSGNARNFITRTKAVRKLQVSLPDFRRLCIFKGIYPREPRNKKKANKGSTASTTFYYTKDIQYLLHEPVLEKFREHKAFAKKLSKALGRGDYSDAKRLEANNKPQVKLDHIVKERYPTFTDALRDLDDAVSMLFLFSNLPTNHNLPPETITTCEKLVNEWQHYIIRTHSLRKSFLSIKGIYYQAEIQGQDILWLVPYKFAQNVPVDVDFRIMGTFVEFYSTLVGFVLFRLYTQEGLVYPPKFDAEADSKGAGLRAFSLEAKSVGLLPAAENKKNTKAMSKQLATLNEKIASLEQKDDEENGPSATLEEEAVAGEGTIDTFKPVANGADVLLQPHMSNVGTAGSEDPSNLFAPFTFFLSRETPRQPLEFLLRSFGCKRIGWDLVLGDGAFTENESDSSITHQIVDRPPVNQVALPLLPETDGDDEMVDASGPRRVNGRIPGRIYVQPQYIWDCVNAGRLLLPNEYGPGALLPPHLSPWVKIDEKTYDPTAPDAAGEEISEDEEEEVEGGMEENLGSDNEGEEDEGEIEAVALDESEPEESEDEDEKAQQEHQRELEAEAAGVKLPARDKKNKDKKKKSKQEREEEEQKEMQKIMMSRRKRKLYEKMQFSNKKKEDEVENLREKRRKIEKAKKKTKA